MSSPEDPHRDDGVVAAAGRVALYPARVAMRASRTRIESSVESVLTGPELARIVDAVLAGPFPEELAHILVERKVLERVATTIAAEIELDDVVDELLARPEVRGGRDERSRLRGDARSGQARRSHSSRRAPRVTSHRPCVGRLIDSTRASRCAALQRPPQFGGVATRAIALVTDAALIGLIGVSISAMATLIASLVGSLRPAWLVGLILAVGLGRPQRRLLRRLLEPRRTDARDEVDARPGSRPAWRAALVRRGRSSACVGLALAIIPCFAGFIPALFDGRRRALPDLIAGTTVEVVDYEGSTTISVTGIS